MTTTPIIDSTVGTWFRRHDREVGPLWRNWNSDTGYRKYIERMAECAEKLGIEAEQVEQLIFGRT